MKTGSFYRSVAAAVRGMVYTFGRERNYRIEVVSTVIVLVFLVVLEASARDYIVCLFVITMILVAELTNTALERAVDILKPHKHPYARVIKDISAAMVLTAAIGGGIIGLFIFIPLIMKLFVY